MLRANLLPPRIQGQVTKGAVRETDTDFWWGNRMDLFPPTS